MSSTQSDRLGSAHVHVFAHVFLKSHSPTFTHSKLALLHTFSLPHLNDTHPNAATQVNSACHGHGFGTQGRVYPYRGSPRRDALHCRHDLPRRSALEYTCQLAIAFPSPIVIAHLIVRLAAPCRITLVFGLPLSSPFIYFAQNMYCSQQSFMQVVSPHSHLCVRCTPTIVSMRAFVRTPIFLAYVPLSRTNRHHGGPFRALFSFTMTRFTRAHGVPPSLSLSCCLRYLLHTQLLTLTCMYFHFFFAGDGVPWRGSDRIWWRQARCHLDQGHAGVSKLQCCCDNCFLQKKYFSPIRRIHESLPQY